MSSQPTLSVVVVDASTAIRAILPSGKSGSNALDQFLAWHQAQVKIFAPEIWLLEVVSLIRQAIYNQWITEGEGRLAVEDVFRLGVEVLPSGVGLCQSALAWASRLGQSKAYDGFYLALAEHLSAELWTGDEKLVQRAKQLGAGWVRCL